MTCPAGFNAGSSCFSATISCPKINDIQVTYGLLGKDTNGTIVLFNGRGGTIVGNVAHIAAYSSKGFQTVQTLWPTDWEDTGAGAGTNVKLAACRPATFMNYVFQTIHSAGGMCAEGTSAGSAAIAYALAEYGAGSYLDNVELLSGPVLTDIALGCNPRTRVVNVCASGCQTGTPPEGGWPDPPQYVGGDQDLIDQWSGAISQCVTQNVPQSQFTAWKGMSIVDGLGDSSFSYPQTAIAGWLCSKTSVNCTKTCQNNSAAEGLLYYASIKRSGQPLNVYRVDRCLGPEGIDAGVLPPPNNSETGFTAITNDMVSACHSRHALMGQSAE